jgi:hypothetical protein
VASTPMQVCTLNGDYVASFQLVCQANTVCPAVQLPATTINLRVETSNFCPSTLAMVDLSASFFTYSDQAFTVQSSNFPQDSTVFGWTEVFSTQATIVSATLFSLKTQQPAPGIADLPLLEVNKRTPAGVLAQLSIFPTNTLLPRITRFSFVLVSTLYPLSTGQSFAPVNIQGTLQPCNRNN